MLFEFVLPIEENRRSVDVELRRSSTQVAQEKIGEINDDQKFGLVDHN
jgi:hypothetical protein